MAKEKEIAKENRRKYQLILKNHIELFYPKPEYRVVIADDMYGYMVFVTNIKSKNPPFRDCFFKLKTNGTIEKISIE